MRTNEYNRIMGFSAGFRFGYVIGNNNISYDFGQINDYMKTHHKHENDSFKWHCRTGIHAGCTQGSYDRLLKLDGVTELMWHMYKKQYINDTEILPDWDASSIELDYYDGPLMMYIDKGEDQRYILVMLERARDFDFWLYIPVTLEMVDNLKSGKSTLADAKRATADRLYVARENNYAARVTLDQLPSYLDVDGEKWYLDENNWDNSGVIRQSESERLVEKLNQFIANGDIKVKMQGVASGYEWSHYPTLICTSPNGEKKTLPIGRIPDWF